jgi:hypothetical protein
MQVPPVPQSQNDLLRPQAGASIKPSLAGIGSKKGLENSKTPFSDHLNEERELSLDDLKASSKRADSGPSSTAPHVDEGAQPPASEVDRGHEGQKGDAFQEDSQAGIADSLQEVPSGLQGETAVTTTDIRTEQRFETSTEAASSKTGNGISRFGDDTIIRIESNSSAVDGEGVLNAQDPTSQTRVLQGTPGTDEVVSPTRDTATANGGVRKTNGLYPGERSSSTTVVGERMSAKSVDLAVKGESPSAHEGAKPSSAASRARIDSAAIEQASNGVRSESDARSGDDRSSGQSKMRSLSELLSRQGIAMDGKKSDVDPALGRVREINQTVAHEQAIRSMGGSVVPGTSSSPLGPMSGLVESSPLEARTSVLSEVLSRSANESKLVERATMITSRGMNALASQRGGSLTMRLDPPGLGQVVIRMTVSDGVVQAELHASNSAGRVVMERGLETLRASLESRGLTVERLSVQASSTSSESQGTRSESNAQDEGQQQSDKDEKEDGRQDAAGRESRGRHEERGVRSDQDDSNQNQQDVSFTQIMSEDAA